MSTRGWRDVITSRAVRVPRQGLSPSRRENRRLLGARDASQACARVAAGRACSSQAIEAVCCLWTQGSTGIEPGTLRPSKSWRLKLEKGRFRADMCPTLAGCRHQFEPGALNSRPKGLRGRSEIVGAHQCLTNLTDWTRPRRLALEPR